MHEISKIDQDFIQELYYVFNGVSLENEPTLLEEDFADTSYLRRYPHQHPYDFNSKEYFSKNNVIEEIKSNYLSIEQKDDLILSIEKGERVLNRYSTWQEIPFDYLNNCAFGFYFISPAAYLFYTPALILNLLLNEEYFKGDAFDKWLSTLVMEDSNSKLLIKFNLSQLKLLKRFLDYVLVDEYALKLVELEYVQKAINIFQEKIDSYAYRI